MLENPVISWTLRRFGQSEGFVHIVGTHWSLALEKGGIL